MWKAVREWTDANAYRIGEMKQASRATFQRQSYLAWGVVSLILVVLLGASIVLGRSAARGDRADAEFRASLYVSDEVEGYVSVARGALDVGSLQGLKRHLSIHVLTDERVERVRVWSLDGELLFSTDVLDPIGSAEALNDQLLEQAAQGAYVSVDSNEGSPEIQTYVPMYVDQSQAVAVAEVDHDIAATVGPTLAKWRFVQFVLLCLLIGSLLGMFFAWRREQEQAGTLQAIESGNVGNGYSVVATQELHDLAESRSHYADRVSNLESRLAELDERRRRAESQLQQSLSSWSVTPPAWTREETGSENGDGPAHVVEEVGPELAEPELAESVSGEIVDLSEEGVLEQEEPTLADEAVDSPEEEPDDLEPNDVIDLSDDEPEVAELEVAEPELIEPEPVEFAHEESAAAETTTAKSREPSELSREEIVAALFGRGDLEHADELEEEILELEPEPVHESIVSPEWVPAGQEPRRERQRSAWEPWSPSDQPRRTADNWAAGPRWTPADDGSSARAALEALERLTTESSAQKSVEASEFRARLERSSARKKPGYRATHPEPPPEESPTPPNWRKVADGAD
jgi:hypothetical protein